MQIRRIWVGLAVGLLLLNGCNSGSTEQTIATATDADAMAKEKCDTDALAGECETDLDAPEGVIKQEPAVPTSLAVGDAAPAINVAQWIVGDEVAGLEPGRVHVVEFWATWCPPCRASMPHLSDLQSQYGSDVAFMGITNEDEQTVQDFLDKPSERDSSRSWREVIGYALALDDAQTMHRSYMAATQQSGIPAAYIVGREGHLLWYGHPMMIDKPLEQIVANEWTRENAADTMAKLEEAQAASRALQRKLSEAQQEGNWDEAITLLDQILEVDPELAAAMGNRIASMRYELFCMAGRQEDAAEMASQLSETLWDDANQLNSLAWNIAVELPETATRDLDLALKLATRASELTDDSDVAVLDTVARVCYERGELDQAIEWQQKAATLADGEGDFAATLEEYRELRDNASSDLKMEEVTTPVESGEAIEMEMEMDDNAAEEPAAEGSTDENTSSEDNDGPGEGGPDEGVDSEDADAYSTSL